MVQIVLVILSLTGTPETRIGPFSSMDACAQAMYVLHQENPDGKYRCEYQPTGD